MVRVFVYCDTNWSLGRVNRSVEKWLKHKYEFTFCDWATRGVDVLENDYDIIVTNLVVLKHLKNKCLKKFIFVNHGYPEMQKEYPLDTIYTATSQSVSSLFPEYIQSRLLYTYNGVEPSNFSFIQKTGEIKKIGWCGGFTFASKHSEWTHEIAKGAELEYEIQSKLTYEEIKKWYNEIDVLLVNSGPEEWRETGPLPPFEAIVSGTLAIGTRVGNFKNVPGPKYDTIEEAVDILNDLKANPEKVLLIMKEQYDYVINHWSYEKIIDGWDEAFQASLRLSSVHN